MKKAVLSTLAIGVAAIALYFAIPEEPVAVPRSVEKALTRSAERLFGEGSLGGGSFSAQENLVIGAATGALEGIESAISDGADVNTPLEHDEFRRTPLMWAAAHSHTLENSGVGIAGALIESGADVNAQSATGSTALGWAASNGSVELVRLLVEAGGDVNLAQDRGVTPLMIAARLGHLDVVTYLLSVGADPSLEAVDGTTALIEAEQADRSDVIEVLQTALDGNEDDTTDKTEQKGDIPL